MATPKIRLLSLDGGGVRGLSELAILNQLVCSINPDSPPLPCELFDMIGGTSTGGIIAIMLGRLRMSVDECMKVYTQLSDRVFTKKRSRMRITGQVQGRFDSDDLATSIKEVLSARGLSPEALLKDDSENACKVFVCATSAETRSTVNLRSYRSPRGRESLFRTTKIWEACRATSAATSFFDPITIGDFGESFVDGGTGANNPINQVWNEAKDVWSLDRMEDHLHCLVSIGTGVPSVKSFGETLPKIMNTLKNIALDTESTAENFVRDRASLEGAGKYYRFNVSRGLEGIGLEEASEVPRIIAATDRYIESQAVFKSLRQCSFILQAFAYLPENFASMTARVSQMTLGEIPTSSSIAPLPDANGMATPSVALPPLHAACKSSDIATVRRLLRSQMVSVEVQQEDDSGQRPLHHAVAAKSLPICRALINAGAIPTAQDHRGWTAVHVAADSGDVQMMKCLADSFFDLQGVDDAGDTPTHIAATAGNIEMVAFLIMHRNTSTNTKNDDGKTPADVAKENGHGDVAALLLSGVDPNVHHLSTVLHWAAETGHVRLLRDQLRDSDVNAMNPNMDTPLILAAKGGHLEACEVLLEAGADLEGKQAEGCTALHVACVTGQLDSVSFLLAKEADIESRCYFGNTPLLSATRAGHYLVMDRLLEKGCDVNAQNTKRLNAMALAVTTKDTRCMAVLLKHLPNSDRRTGAAIGAAVAAQVADLTMLEFLLQEAGDGPEAKARHMLMLSLALNQPDDTMMELLIRKGADVNGLDQTGKSLLQACVDQMNTVQLKALLKHGAKPSGKAQLKDIWNLAVIHGDGDLTETLISKFGMDVSTLVQGRPALLTAVVFEQLEVVVVLLQHNADINHGEQDETALHIAAGGRPEIVKVLLDHGAHVDCEDRNGETPLHRATETRAAEIVQMLLSAGANPRGGSSSESPLALATQTGNTGIVEALLDGGADLNAKDGSGRTPLEVAIEKSNNEIIVLLQKHGAEIKSVAVDTLIEMIPKRKLGEGEREIVHKLIKGAVDINRKDRDGKTPLITACNCADAETVRNLLTNGADPNLQDPHGAPPLYFAIVCEDPDSVGALIKAGADIHLADDNGRSAIEWVVERREARENEMILDAILEKGPNLNRKIRGNPLLYHAIMNGKNAYTIRRLIEEGIDVSATIGGYRPTNALHWVELMGSCRAQRSIREMLVQYGVPKI